MNAAVTCRDRPADATRTPLHQAGKGLASLPKWSVHAMKPAEFETLIGLLLAAIGFDAVVVIASACARRA